MIKLILVWLLIDACLTTDYHKYVNRRDDFIDPLDPLAVFEKPDSVEEDTIVKEVVTPLFTKPETKPSDKKLIHPDDCPQNCTNATERKNIDGGIYYKRFVSSLMRKLERRLPRDLKDRTIAFNMLITLQQMDVTGLRQFLNQENRGFQDVTDTMCDMVKLVQLADTADMEQWDFDEILGINVTLVLKCVAILLCLVGLTILLTKIHLSLKLLFRMFIGLFIISIPWDWMQLYKKAIARKASELATTAPEHCTPMLERSSFSQLKFWFASSFSFSDDPCKVYHEAVLVDPVLDVPPVEALTATVMKLIVNPLQYVGSGLVKFLNEIGKGLPTQYAVGVFFFIGLMVLVAVVVFVIWLIMKMDYQIRLPFYGGLERAPVRSVEAPVRRRSVGAVQDVERPRLAAPLRRPLSYPAYLPNPDDDLHDDVSSDTNLRRRLAPVDRGSSSGDESRRPGSARRRHDPTRRRHDPTTRRLGQHEELVEPKETVSSSHVGEQYMASGDASSYPSHLIVGTRTEIDIENDGDADSNFDSADSADIDVLDSASVGHEESNNDYEVIEPRDFDSYTEISSIHSSAAVEADRQDVSHT